MAPFQKHQSLVTEGALGFVLGAVGGCALGATVTPVNEAMTEIISTSLLKPVTEGMRTVGPLGLGTLLGATATTIAMTAAVTGVTVAASVALLLCRFQNNSNSLNGLAWVATGLAAAIGATSCGAALGVIIETYTISYGVVVWLWTLGILAMLKIIFHLFVERIFKENENGNLDQLTQAAKKLEAMETEQRERVALEIEQRLIALEKSVEEQEVKEYRVVWEAEQHKRKEMTKQREAMHQTLMKMTLKKRLTKIITKYVEFLAFSGIPMTVSAVVTAGFGLFGFGDHRFVFVILLALVLFMVFMLIRSGHPNFWMFAACMGMFATFAIAVLTVHAGQEVVDMSIRLRMAGKALRKEELLAKMDYQSSLETITAGFFVAKMCQIALGASVGVPLYQKDLKKVIVGAFITTVVILSVVKESSKTLGVGGVTGALLGALGAAGMSLGAAAATAVHCPTWVGSLSTTAGILLGALAIGNLDFLNIGLQVLLAFMSAMVNPY